MFLPNGVPLSAPRFLPSLPLWHRVTRVLLSFLRQVWSIPLLSLSTSCLVLRSRICSYGFHRREVITSWAPWQARQALAWEKQPEG